MDLLTAEEPRVASPALRYWPPLTAFVAYLFVIGFTIAHHEPWADEAQSWLLARDASLVELWTRLLHYEGTTGLWQTLLHLLIRAGLAYPGMNIVSGLIAAGAAYLVFSQSPFPLAIRLTLPFTYFLCYQYAVIARSYDLLPLLMFASAVLFDRAAKHKQLFTSLLCLMAAVSVHGMILAVSIGIAAAARDRQWRLNLPYLATFALVTALLIHAAWPASDGTFVTRLNFSVIHFGAVTGKAFAGAFTGETYTSLLVIALTIPFLWRGGGILFFALACSTLCAVGAIVYSQVWHFGVLFLVWIFALWISYRELPDNKPDRKLAMVAIGAVLMIQCYWTCRAVLYDWNEPYSAGKAAASGLRELDLTHRRLYAIGYACVAIQPYFPRNIFSNWNEGRAAAYWDWSSRNRVNQDSLHLAQLRPDYVIIGYKNEFEHGVWSDLAKKNSYREIRHFEGNSFWHSGVLEPESFDLYRWNDGR